MSLLPRHYRRDGTLYPAGERGLFEWARDLEGGKNIVRQDRLADGSFVSTVWIGIDMDHFSILRGTPHAPLIFETMVWDAHDEIVDLRRWPSEDDAIIGHIEAVERQQARVAHGHN